METHPNPKSVKYGQILRDKAQDGASKTKTDAGLFELLSLTEDYKMSKYLESVFDIVKVCS